MLNVESDILEELTNHINNNLKKIKTRNENYYMYQLIHMEHQRKSYKRQNKKMKCSICEKEYTYRYFIYVHERKCN